MRVESERRFIKQISLKLEKEGIATPQIIYSPEILHSSFPFEVNVNDQKLGQLMSAFGMKPKDISEHKVILTRRDPEFTSDRMATYYPSSKSIVIDMDKFLLFFSATLCYKSIFRQEDGSLNFDGLLTTKRLPSYLEVAPTERADAFREKIFQKALERIMRGAIIHEAKHAGDISNTPQRFKMILEADLSFFWQSIIDLANRKKPIGQVDYLEQFIENRAKMTEEILKAHPLLQDLVTFRISTLQVS